jgi:Haem-binding domain
MRRFVLATLLVILGLVVAIQAVPYGRRHTNPPVLAEPNWDTPQTRTLAARACFDCHSNETVWPWYSSVAPISWLVQHDIDQGRQVVNFSEWNRPQKDAPESPNTVLEGEMPPWVYTIRSSAARLSATEKAVLARGLAATLGSRNSAGARPTRDD